MSFKVLKDINIYLYRIQWRYYISGNCYCTNLKIENKVLCLTVLSELFILQLSFYKGLSGSFYSLSHFSSIHDRDRVLFILWLFSFTPLISVFNPSLILTYSIHSLLLLFVDTPLLMMTSMRIDEAIRLIYAIYIH